MSKRPLRSTRPLHGWEDNPSVEGEEWYKPVPRKSVDTVLGIEARTLTDHVKVECRGCKSRFRCNRLLDARQFMRSHFLFWAKSNLKGHNSFKVTCHINLSRRFHYRDEVNAKDDTYWVQMTVEPTR